MVAHGLVVAVEATSSLLTQHQRRLAVLTPFGGGTSLAAGTARLHLSGCNQEAVRDLRVVTGPEALRRNELVTPCH